MVYLKVYHQLKNGINTGFYRQGESLPAEVDLARQFDVSRNTLRKALKMLQNGGFLRCRQGAGNFVSCKSANADFLQNSQGFSEIIQSDKTTAKSHVLKFEIQLASPVIANALAIKFKEQVYFISRVRFINDSPAELENSWISAEKFPDLTLKYIKGSLYDYFENKCRVHMSGTYLHYSPLLPSREIAALLKIDKEMPVIKVQSQSVDMWNVPFLFSENYTNFLEYPLKIFVSRKRTNYSAPT